MEQQDEVDQTDDQEKTGNTGAKKSFSKQLREDFWYTVAYKYGEVFYLVVGIIIIALVAFVLKAIGYKP